MSESSPTLVLKEITAGYGSGPPIVEQVSIKAEAGQITAIVGPNGAGKSTLMKVVSGMLKPSHGEVLLDGQNVAGLAPEQLVRLGLSYVPQVANIFPSLTVMENLEMGGYAMRGGVRERAAEMCQLFPDLAASLSRQAKTLSGGQRTMLAIARGLMLRPKVLLLDEPTAGLAPRFVNTVWDQITKVRELGVALMLVEQNTRRALSQADWAYVMAMGRTRLEGTGPALLNDEEVVSLYVGKA